jgi:glycine/D-amino acid oxidase-like deaminating enzyme
VTDYDVIVIGCGGVGSAALYHLASRGYRALAIDRFPPGHDRGSSHGETRVIRQAYFEHPDYVPMLQRAYQLWEELGNEVGSPLFHKTGVLQLGPERGEVIAGVLESARLHGLDVSRAGYLEVEACIHAHVDLAEKQGARLSIGEAVLEWHNNGSDVTVRTDKSTYQAQSLIVTAGSWSSDLLPGLDLTVRRKHLHWYANDDPVYREDNGCPVFFFELDHGLFYGFPQRDTLGVKVSEHSGGETLTDPLNVDRTEYRHRRPGDHRDFPQRSSTRRWRHANSPRSLYVHHVTGRSLYRRPCARSGQRRVRSRTFRPRLQICECPRRADGRAGNFGDRNRFGFSQSAAIQLTATKRKPYKR